MVTPHFRISQARDIRPMTLVPQHPGRIIRIESPVQITAAHGRIKAWRESDNRNMTERTFVRLLKPQDNKRAAGVGRVLFNPPSRGMAVDGMAG